MKKAIAALVAVGLLLVGAGSASAASPVEKKIAALQRQMNTLEKQNASLQKQVTKLKKDVTTAQDVGIASLQFGICLAAITGDALQNTWTVINQVAGRTIFAAPATLSDQGVCLSNRIQRQPTQVPPTIAPLNSLLNLLNGSLLPRWAWR